MRPPQTKTTRFYTIPLRSPIPGAPPKYVAVPVSIPANANNNDQRTSTGTTTTVRVAATSSTSSSASKATQMSPTKTALGSPKAKPKPKPSIVQRRARSVPLQEMREAVIDIRDNARPGSPRRDDDSANSTSKKMTSDTMPADDLHFLKYWEM